AATVSRARATCPCCNMVLPAERVRAQLGDQRGGADVEFGEDGQRVGGSMLTTVVCVKPGEPGRRYRLATQDDYVAVWLASKRAKQYWSETSAEADCPAIPSEPTPLGGGSGAGRAFSVHKYGMLTWAD